MTEPRKMGYVLSRIEEMSAYTPGEQPDSSGRVVKLNTNENPYPPSPYVALALHEELNEGREPGDLLRLYPNPRADLLRRTAAEVHDIPVEGVLAGNGSDELLALLFRACVAPGDPVVWPCPTYTLYEVLARMRGAKVQACDFPPEFTLPRKLFGNPGKLTVVVSPNSPTGTLFAPAELEELARSLSGLLVIDEAYIEFSHGGAGAAPGALELVRRLPNVVVVRTLSKSHSLAGLRVGLLFGAPELVGELDKVRDSYNLDRLAQRAGVEALKDVEWTRQNVSAVRATRDSLNAGLRDLGLEVLPSEANFVFARFPAGRFSAPAEAAAETCRRLKERGIFVRWFPDRSVSDGLRVTVGSDKEIGVFLHALKECLPSE